MSALCTWLSPGASPRELLYMSLSPGANLQEMLLSFSTGAFLCGMCFTQML